MIKIAIVGSQGVPAQYGGFETLVEYLVRYHDKKEMEITVFASSKIYGRKASRAYKGAKIAYVPFSPNGAFSVLYDTVSLLRSCKTYDRIFVLGASGGIIFPFLKKYTDKFILNVGGLEWGRSKWGWFAKKYLKWAEKQAVEGSATLIADNKGIQEYIAREYGRSSELIAYGGDQACRVGVSEEYVKRYPFLSEKYIVNVARIQPDNNIEMILQAFESVPDYKLVMVGNWMSSAFGIQLKKKYAADPSVILLDPVYDQTLLNVIRSNSVLYLHGHSAGGTNPALVEAMYLGLPIYCYDNGFNNHTTKNEAVYFKSAQELHELLMNLDEQTLSELGKRMKTIANENYIWKTVVTQYMNLCK